MFELIFSQIIRIINYLPYYLTIYLTWVFSSDVTNYVAYIHYMHFHQDGNALFFWGEADV